MTLWILGLALLTATQSPAASQDPCSTGRAVRVVSSVIPALGQSPIWAATGGKPLVWENATTPIRVLWLRDVTAKGPGFLTAPPAVKQAKGTAGVTLATSMYGSRQQRLTLDPIGDKPTGVKDVDLKKYAFHWTFMWFPSPGCYPITGSVGSQKSIIHLNVVASGKQGT